VPQAELAPDLATGDVERADDAGAAEAYGGHSSGRAVAGAEEERRDHLGPYEPPGIVRAVGTVVSEVDHRAGRVGVPKPSFDRGQAGPVTLEPGDDGLPGIGHRAHRRAGTSCVSGQSGI
jgi:hypothetical protein